MVESIEYRNLAPLYCDEEMHICAKKKKETDRGTTWDVWIEGPTGGMAVKAVVRTVARAKENYFANSMAKTITSTKLPDVQTVAAQAQDKLNALDRNNSSPEQLSQFSREERRKLWREEQRGKRREEKQPSSTPPSRELVPFSKVWREQWIGKHLQYLYRWENSPLITRTTLPVRDSIALSPTLGKTNSDDPVDKSLEQPSSAMNAAQDPATTSVVTPLSRPSSVLSQAQRQRQILQANMAAQTPTVRMTDSIPDVSTTESSPDALETADPSSSASLQKKPKTKRPAQRASRQKKKTRLVIKKVEQVSVRKVADHGLSDLQNEGSSKRVMEQKRSALRRAVQVANKERSAKDGSEEKSNG
ncbi:hypothetical protein SLS59_002042 [Nothophoma quercina]|uniref:Uncharacterized protein n=1 Tax=Nothophoma quercina TaxID=749835 RepID=A0ABR3RWN9_9PLEO